MWRDGEDMARGVASRHSRSGFLSRIGAPIIAWVAGPLAGSSSLGPESTRYYGFCGHTFTTKPCPHPFPKLPRIDRHGYPLRPVRRARGRQPRPARGRVRVRPRRRREPPRWARPASRSRGRRARGRARTGCRTSTASTRASTAPGTAAARARSESSSTAAPITTAASTATRRSWATASTAARCSASSTTTPRCRAEGRRSDRRRGRRGNRARHRHHPGSRSGDRRVRAPRGRLGRLVALRAGRGRDGRPRRARGEEMADCGGGVRGRCRRGRSGARVGARLGSAPGPAAGARTRRGRLRRSSPPTPAVRPGSCASLSRSSVARCRSGGARCCRCRPRRSSTAPASGSGSSRTCRWRPSRPSSPRSCWPTRRRAPSLSARSAPAARSSSIAATAGLRDWDAAADRFERAGRMAAAGGGGLRIANAGAHGGAGRACSLRPRRPPPPSRRCGSTSAPITSPIRRAGPGRVLAWDQVTGGVVQGKLRVNGVVQRPPRQDARRRRDAGRRRHRLGVSDRRHREPRRPADAPAEGHRAGALRPLARVSAGHHRRRLILYDLGTNQSRVIATVKMRSDLGEPDISGRRVVYSVTGKGSKLDQDLPDGPPDDAPGAPDADLVIQPRVDQRDTVTYVRQGVERRGGVAPRPRERADAARLPGRRTARAAPCGRRPRTARPPTSRSTRSRSRSSGMLEAWQPRLRRRVSCAPRSSRRRSGARPISTGSATCPSSPRSSRARSRRRCRSTRPRPASRWPTSWPTSTASSIPGITHWNHPGFMAYFGISGSPPGILGETVAAALNVNAMLWRTSPAATELEQRVLRWVAELIGLPTGWFGEITDTASASTHVCARRRARGGRARHPHARDGGPDRPAAASRLHVRPGALLGREGLHRPRARTGGAAQAPDRRRVPDARRPARGGRRRGRRRRRAAARGRRDRRHDVDDERRPGRGGRRRVRARTACGCTSTPRTAARRRSCRRCATCSTAATGPTRLS